MGPMTSLRHNLLLILGFLIVFTYYCQAHKYSANLHEAKFESSRTSRASQSSAINNRDSVRIGKRNDVTTTEGSVSPTKKKSFKREHFSHVPLKSNEQKTQTNRNGARNLRRRISNPDDSNFKKYDTDRFQKDVPKDVPKKDSSNTSVEINEKGFNHDFTRIKQTDFRISKKDSEKKDKKQLRHSYPKNPEGRSSAVFKNDRSLSANQQMHKEVTPSNYANLQSHTSSVKTNQVQGIRNSEGNGKDQESIPAENVDRKEDFKSDITSLERNKRKRKKVLRLRNRHKNETMTMETKPSPDNQMKSNGKVDISPSFPLLPDSVENKKENNTHARDNSEAIINDKIITDLNIPVDETFDHTPNIKETKSDLDVPSDEIVHYPPQNNDSEQPKTDFTSPEDEAEEYEYEFPKEKFNATPLPEIESNDEKNGEYMLTFNYKGSKKDQPKDVIKLSDSISKNGYAKKAQIIPEKKLSFKKPENFKTELHAVRNERTGGEKVPHVAKMEFSKRFKTLPDNGIVKEPVEAEITRNYDLDITTKAPIAFKRKTTKKLDESVWTPAKIEKYPSYENEQNPQKEHRSKDFIKSNNEETFFHSYNDRSPYSGKNNFYDKTASLTNNEKSGFIKKDSADSVLKPYNKMLPVKKQLVSSSDDDGKYFMHMFKRVGDVSLEHFSPQSSEMSRNDGFMSAIKLRWNEDDTRAQIEASVDSRMQPSSFEFSSDMFRNSYGKRLTSDEVIQKENSNKRIENSGIRRRNLAEIEDNGSLKHIRKMSRRKRSPNVKDHYFQSHFTIGSERPFTVDSENFSNNFKETLRQPRTSMVPRKELLKINRRQFESPTQKPEARIDRRRSNFEDKPYYLKPDMKNFKNIPMKLIPQSRTENPPMNPEVRSYYLKPEDATEIKKLTNDFHSKQLQFPFASYEKPARETKTIESFQPFPSVNSNPELHSSQVGQREGATVTPQNNNYKNLMTSSHNNREFYSPSYRIPLERKPTQESKNIESFYVSKPVMNQTPQLRTFPTDQREMWNIRLTPESNKNSIKSNRNSNMAFYSSSRRPKPAQESKTIESFQSYFEMPKKVVNQPPEFGNFYTNKKSGNNEMLSLIRSPIDMIISKQKPIEESDTIKSFQRDNVTKQLENQTPGIRNISTDHRETQNVQGLHRNSNKSLAKLNYSTNKVFLQNAPSEMKMSSIKLNRNPSEESNKNKIKNGQFGLRPKVFGKEKLLTNEKADSLNKSRFEARVNKPKQIDPSKFQKRTEKLNLKISRHPFLNDRVKTQENKNQLNVRKKAGTEIEAINLKQDQDLMKQTEDVNLKRNQEILRRPERVHLKPNPELTKRPENVNSKPSQTLMKRKSEKANLEHNQELLKRSENQHLHHLSGDSAYPLTGAHNNIRNNARTIDPHAWEYGFEQPKIGVNFPGYSSIPKTNFQCRGKNGYFADPEAGCQVFHMCQGRGVKHSFLCPNNTIFNQHLLVCDWYNRVSCEGSEPQHRISDFIYNQNSNLNNVRNDLHTPSEYENHQWQWAEQQARSNNYGNFRTANTQGRDNKKTLNKPHVVILDTPRNYRYENNHAQRNINNQRSRIPPSNLNLKNLQDSSDVLKSSFSLPKSLTKVPNNIEDNSKNVKYENIQKDKTVNKENPYLHNNFRSEKIINEQFVPDSETSPRGFHYFKENEYLVLHDNANQENNHQKPVPKVYNREEKVNVKNSWKPPKLQNQEMELERISPTVNSFKDTQSTIASDIPERKPLSRRNFNAYKPKETHLAAMRNQKTIKQQKGESTITLEELEKEKQKPRYHQQTINMDSISRIVPIKNKDFSTNFESVNSKSLLDELSITTEEPRPAKYEIYSEKELTIPFVETTTLIEEKDNSGKSTTQRPFDTPNTNLATDYNLDGSEKDARYKSAASLEQTSKSGKDPKMPIYTYPLSPTLRKTDETTQRNFGDRIDKPKDGNIQNKSNSLSGEVKSQINIHTRKNEAPKINITSRIVDVLSKIESIGTDVSRILDGKGNVYKNINIQKLKPTIPPQKILNINLDSFTSTKPLKKTDDTKSEHSILLPPIKVLPKVLTNINTELSSQTNLKNTLLHEIQGKSNKSSEFTTESSINISRVTPKNESQNVPYVSNGKKIETPAKTGFHNKDIKMHPSEMLQQRKGQHHNINEHVQSKKPVEIFTKRKYDQKISNFKPKQRTVYTNMKPNGYVIKIGPLKREKMKYQQNIKKEIPNSRIEEDHTHSNNPQQNARSNLFSFTTTTPKSEQIPTFTPQNILSSTASSRNSNHDKFQISHLRPNPHPSLKIHQKHTNQQEHPDNRHNINEKYLQGTRSRHTYQNIPQRMPIPHSHNEKYSNTELPLTTKASLPQANLPAFIFTVNPLPGHRTPDWKSGQNYNPGQLQIPRPISAPPVHMKQKVEGKIQSFNQKEAVNTESEDDDDDCDDSLSPTEIVESSSYFSLGKHGPNTQSSEKTFRPEESIMKYRGRTERKSNNENNSKEIKCKSLNGNKSKHKLPTARHSINEPTTPISQIKSPFKKGFANYPHLVHSPKNTHQNSYGVQKNIHLYKQELPQKIVTSFQPQFLSPTLIKKYIPKNVMLNKKLSPESGIHSKTHKKLRNTRSSEELSSSIEKSEEDSKSIDNIKKEYAALERAVELEAEKMVKSTTQSS
ncbi:uncharacterized protein TNCT_602891 [Trichonephila clavata]|uniref:Chitin-binding type-2 domain-containing protein n=1 Tax=Trichonephila clavata TaxID=2740835 RepID=A0A8X6GUD5_TRICU|nr:uncharacterized protein TNCT_602891 [Trichonephila clavata]